MRHLTLCFFGTFGATLGGEPITKFRSVKIQGILVYLVLTPQQTHRRDAVAAMFWPDEPETTAKHNLRQSLYWLRQLLGDTAGEKRAFLHITNTTVQFNSAGDHSLDVADFLAALEQEDLETAVSLYQGDLLPALAVTAYPLTTGYDKNGSSIIG